MTRPPEYAVMVIPARCGHVVDVQLCGDFETNKALTAQAQAANCAPCVVAGVPWVKRLPKTERED